MNTKKPANENLVQDAVLDQFDFFEEEYIESVKDKYSILIGQFLINFSRLEHEINIALADFINDRAHDPGYLFIEYLEMKDKINCYSKMYIRFTETIEKLKKEDLLKIKKELISVSEFRNSLAHANWTTLTKEGFVRTDAKVDKKDGYVKFQMEKITPKILRNKINEIDKLVKKILKIQELILNEN